MKRKRAGFIFAAVLVLTLLTGCMNYRELETMAIVTGMAFERGNGGAGYHLVFEVLDTSGDGGGQGPAVKSQLIEADGNTLFDASRNAVRKTDKQLYYGHCKTVIISDELAREGITPILDWLNRDSEPRLTLNLFISKEDRPKEILGQKSLNNPITAYALSSIDENNSQFLSISAQLYQVNNMLGGEGISLILPALIMADNPDEQIIELSGTAVFKEDNLVGYLGDEESKYLIFIKNQVSGGSLAVGIESEVPDISLEILDNKTKITPVLTGESPEIKIDIRTQAALGEIQTSTDFNTESGIKEIEEKASAVIEENIRQLIAKAQQEYDSDIFGFGHAVYMSDPGDWQKIKPRWDSWFRSLKVDVSAEVKIINTGLTKSKVKVGE